MKKILKGVIAIATLSLSLTFCKPVVAKANTPQRTAKEAVVLEKLQDSNTTLSNALFIIPESDNNKSSNQLGLEVDDNYFSSLLLSGSFEKKADQKNATVKKEVSMYDKLSSSEYDLLCKVTFAEAGNQGLDGQQAVAGVILARMASESFPDTILGVISQTNQFSTWNNNNVVCYYGVVTEEDGAAMKEAVNAAIKKGSGLSNYFNGQEPLYFHVPNYNEYTISGKSYILKNHIFSVNYLG